MVEGKPVVCPGTAGGQGPVYAPTAGVRQADSPEFTIGACRRGTRGDPDHYPMDGTRQVRPIIDNECAATAPDQGQRRQRILASLQVYVPGSAHRRANAGLLIVSNIAVAFRAYSDRALLLSAPAAPPSTVTVGPP